MTTCPPADSGTPNRPAGAYEREQKRIARTPAVIMAAPPTNAAILSVIRGAFVYNVVRGRASLMALSEHPGDKKLSTVFVSTEPRLRARLITANYL